jgi:hypothetical protein
VIHFLALELRKISFGIGFLLPGSIKMNYICNKLNPFETYLILQLKINHGLADIIVINRY